MNILQSFMGLFSGSPKTTRNKAKLIKDVEDYSNLGKSTREEISFHFLNGTVIPSIILLKQKAIGRGLNIQSRTKVNEIDDAFEILIKQHAKKKNFEVSSTMPREEALKMCMSEKYRKGGVLVRHRYDTRWNIPYKLEIIGVDRINVSKYNKEERILNGLKKDKYGAIVSYFIFKDSTQKETIEIPASDISAYMDKWMDITQYTAVSRLTQLLPDLDDLLKYHKDELEAASDRTQGSVFWHTKMYDTVVSAMEELYKSLKNSKQVTSDTFAELTEIQRELTRQMSAEGLVPGNVKAIPSEDSITDLKNNSASTYESFSKNNMDKISASQGFSSASVSQDYIKTNWATIDYIDRQGEHTHQEEINSIQAHLLDEYLERLFRVGVQIGRIPLKINEYIKNPEAYHQWKILRQSTSALDERKKQTAYGAALEIGTKTLVSIYEDEGLDYKEEKLKQAKVDIELELEIKKLYEAAGLPTPNENDQNQQKGETSE
jgi:hypothetical protein